MDRYQNIQNLNKNLGQIADILEQYNSCPNSSLGCGGKWDENYKTLCNDCAKGMLRLLVIMLEGEDSLDI